VKSYFFWEGRIQSSQEIILLIKTLPEKKEKCIAYIKKNHPYDVPEISVIEIYEQDIQYLEWMKSLL
jgi:periplasmic divalent cation tolerance protein